MSTKGSVMVMVTVILTPLTPTGTLSLLAPVMLPPSRRARPARRRCTSMRRVELLPDAARLVLLGLSRVDTGGLFHS